MASNGIGGFLIETHNWGKTVAFWQQLGYALEFETDHSSGMLRHPAGGPYLFVAERAPGAPLDLHPIILVDDAAGFAAPSGTVDRPFEAQHWDVVEMLLHELGHQPTLEAALGYLDLLAEQEPDKLERACVQWHGRLETEAPSLSLADSQLALTALESLCLGERHGITMLQRLLRQVRPDAEDQSAASRAVSRT